jgi:ectoine hydroxylase-related dioxygenase (phytanoyl-CoA dioxygenase family)
LAARLSRYGSIDATWGSAREAVAEAAKTQIFHCHDVQFQSAAFSRLIVDDRLTSAASQIIGSPNVQLHHTKMFIKPPETGSPFPMHQDYDYFPHDSNTMMAAIIHFDDAPLERGCVRVYPGSHKLGPLGQSHQGGWHLSFEEYPIEKATPCPAEAGDVLFFSYLTIHGSGINESSEARTTLLVQMRDPEDVPSEQVHISRGQGMMLRGIDPLAGQTAQK